MIIIFKFLNKAKKFKKQGISNKNYNKCKKILIFMRIMKIKNNLLKNLQPKENNNLFYKKMKVSKNKSNRIKLVIIIRQKNNKKNKILLHDFFFLKNYIYLIYLYQKNNLYKYL